MMSLRTLSTDVYDSVFRIADGYEPDVADKKCLTIAAETLRGEAELLEFVESHAKGPEPKHLVLTGEYWMYPVRQAVSQLNMTISYGETDIACLGELADQLEVIALGDRDQAKAAESIVQRIAILVSMQRVS
jgi:hypothetical protein